MTTDNSDYLPRQVVRAGFRRERTLRIEWKPQDCWVGVFWKHSDQPLLCQGPRTALDVWVCLLPMLPLHYSSRLTRDNAR